jgi:hypothetical protein
VKFLSFLFSFGKREHRGSGTPAEPQPVVAADTHVPNETEVDSLLQGVEEAIDRKVFGDDPRMVESELTGADLDTAAMHELFHDIVANHVQPVKNFIFELRRGKPRKDSLEICRPVMAPVIEAAESMGLPEAAVHMNEFAKTMALAAEDRGDAFSVTSRALILESYEALAASLPRSFKLDDKAEKRDTVIIHSLLKQVPDVGHVTFDRLYGSGVISLEILHEATPHELEATTGIPGWLCERICKHLEDHRNNTGGGDEAGQREKLAWYLTELRTEHSNYLRASEQELQDHSAGAQKRAARLSRQACSLKIEVLLAEKGELELVDRIRKYSAERQIKTLEAYLSSDVVTFDAAKPNKGQDSRVSR